MLLEIICVWIEVLNPTQPLYNITLVPILSCFPRWHFIPYSVLSLHPSKNCRSFLVMTFFLFLPHWENGVNQKITSKGFHHIYTLFSPAYNSARNAIYIFFWDCGWTLVVSQSQSLSSCIRAHSLAYSRMLLNNSFHFLYYITNILPLY